MPPDGMGLFHVSHAEGFTPAEVPGVVVVKHHVIVQQDHRMARVGSGNGWRIITSPGTASLAEI